MNWNWTYVRGFGTGVALGMLLMVALAVSNARDSGPTVELARATVVHVDDEREWQTPRTLLEYEDGQRGVVTGYYGEVGDTFVIQRPVR